MSKVIGIDPGVTGAIVVLENGVPTEWTMMPTYQAGSHKRVSVYALSRWINEVRLSGEIDKAYIEQVGARPGQGVTSMFSFGHAVGSVMGILGANEIPFDQVLPTAWKRRAGLINEGKDAARSRAIQIWPKWADLDKKIKGQALADAALIAKFGEQSGKFEKLPSRIGELNGI